MTHSICRACNSVIACADLNRLSHVVDRVKMLTFRASEAPLGFLSWPLTTMGTTLQTHVTHPLEKIQVDQHGRGVGVVAALWSEGKGLQEERH